MGILSRASNGEWVNLGLRVLVGRSASCALRLQSQLISGEHAVLWWSEGRWWVRDLGSRNGTCLEGRRLPPGEPQPLDPGVRLSFGGREESWTLVDAAPPTLFARDLRTDERCFARDGLLLLPDEARPEITVFGDTRGRWLAELEQEVLEVEDGQVLTVGEAAWQLSVPRGSSSALPATREAVEPLSLHFFVSPDEEHVDVRVRYSGRSFALEPRVYHYMLLTLARARIEDQQVGRQEEGWLFTDDLMQMLRIDRETMNLYVYRCRKQLAALGIPAAGELLERRPHTRQLRIGTPLIEVSPL